MNTMNKTSENQAQCAIQNVICRADNFDTKIDIGTILKKGKKRYVVIHWDILCAGHTKLFLLIRLYDEYLPLIRITKQVYDSDIKKYFVVQY